MSAKTVYGNRGAGVRLVHSMKSFEQRQLRLGTECAETVQENWNELQDWLVLFLKLFSLHFVLYEEDSCSQQWSNNG